MTLLRQAAATGLVLGALWGAFEAWWVLLGPWVRFSLLKGTPESIDWAQSCAVLLLAARRHAVLGLVATPLICGVLGALRRSWRENERLAPLVMVTLVLFVELYWWTKPLSAASWGLPFHHPLRLGVSLGWLALAGLVAWLVVARAGVGVPSRGRVLALALAVGGGSLWAAAHDGARGGRARPPADAPNVLLVVADTLRADRLGCYGYDAREDLSPHIDAFADQGVLFERTWAQAPFTWTSFGSFFTGKYPRRHGLIKMSPDQRLDLTTNTTLAEVLNDHGYATGAFLTGALSNNTGLLGGFDTYFEAHVGHERVDRHSKWSIVRSRMVVSILWNKLRQALDPRLVNTEARDWIGEQGEQPWFAIVHYFATHTPYDPPGPYGERYDPGYTGAFHPFEQHHAVGLMKAEHKEGVCPYDGEPAWSCDHFVPERDVNHISALYDGGVAFVDEMFGGLLEELDARGVDDETLVIFTSDHGEELYDHRVFEHDWMFDTNLHVPLILRLPDRRFAGTRVDWPVELIDLPPTVLDVAGLGPMDDVDGRSLVADMQGRDPGVEQHTVFAENVRYVAMRDGRYKVVRSRYTDSVRVLDLEVDPGEYRPLDLTDEAHAAVVSDLMSRMAAYEASMPAVTATFEVDRALLTRLAALGYLGAMNASAEVEGGGDVVEDELGDRLMLGSNELLEEDLYPFETSAPEEVEAPAPDEESDR